eukprot:TRINITY_DN1091_c0_g1_i1.p1 TRINITY_DN1091_c0_g1~~TRINITY_DN1091_c0_g1_i1.p1  ORF type:complete len:469 (+),score=119.37 TRINITY_DN1091_c0_g1_i1:199-1605(+)
MAGSTSLGKGLDFGLVNPSSTVLNGSGEPFISSDPVVSPTPGFGDSPEGIYPRQDDTGSFLNGKQEPKQSPPMQTVPVSYVTVDEPGTSNAQVLAQPMPLSLPLAKFVEMQQRTRQAKPRRSASSQKRLQQNRAAQQRHRARKRQDVEQLQKKAEELSVREKELSESKAENEALKSDKKLLEDELKRKDREIMMLLEQNSQLRQSGSPKGDNNPDSPLNLDHARNSSETLEAIDKAGLDEEDEEKYAALHAEYAQAVEELKTRIEEGATCNELKATVARCHEIVASIIHRFGPFERPCCNGTVQQDMMVMEGGGELSQFENLKKLQCDKQRWIEITKSLELSEEEVGKIMENRDRLLKSMAPIYEERKLLNDKVKELMKDNLVDQTVTTHQAAKRSHEAETKVVKALDALRRNLLSEQLLRQEFQRTFFDKLSCKHTAQIMIESYPLPVNAMAVTNTIHAMRTGAPHH